MVTHLRFFWVWLNSGRKFACLVLILVTAVCGCKADLYTANQQDANEMVALLLNYGIDSECIPGKEGVWIVRAEKSQYARAVLVLRDYGYPKTDFNSIGEIFKKQGLVTSPLEDRIRFIYALSQELSETLSYMDGVLKARVHVVLPENNPNAYVEVIKPSSAAVFIKYREDVSIASRIPKIKELVVNSIEGLLYEKVTVALFPSKVGTVKLKQGMAGPMAIKLKKLSWLCIALGVLLALSLWASVFLYSKSEFTISSLAKEFKEGYGLWRS